MKYILLIFFMAAAAFPQANSEKLVMPAIFSDNMVLQQKSDVAFWGKAAPGETVTVKTGWGASAKTVTDKTGEWKVKVKTIKAGGPYEIKVASVGAEINYKNVLLGEVWICSGQSNMEMPMQGWPPQSVINNAAEEINNADYPEIRLFTVTKAMSVEPEYNCRGSWSECSPKTAASFSATAYFFGRELFKNIKVPIGLVSTNWGGTNIESWISGKYLGNVSDYKPQVEKIAASREDFEKYNAWLKSRPVIDVSDLSPDKKWNNLNFDDTLCSSINFDDSKWHNMNLPVYWESTEVGSFDGVVWFRKKVDIPKEWIGKALVAELGPIDDMDRTFVNGAYVGGFEIAGYWDKPRVYDIPGNLVNDSILTIAVRVLDTGGGGGIFGNNVKMRIHLKDSSEEVSLAGDWKYLPVAQYLNDTFYVFKLENNDFFSRPKMPVEVSPNTPTVLYNGMIAPLIPYGIKGAIWYQGEANCGRPNNYDALMSLMINNWRKDWGEGNFPFYYVQIAPYTYSASEKSYIIRDKQFASLSVPNTGMAVTLDIATVDNIHPPDKQDVGKRLALWALAKNYNKKLEYSGPLYKSMKIEKGKIILTFTHTAKGLIYKPLKNESNFIIAGKDKKFVKADVKVAGGKLIVSSPEVKEPAAVRYTWSNTEEATLFNSVMLPASTFKTDDWND